MREAVFVPEGSLSHTSSYRATEVAVLGVRFP